jgi:hypothetical protein
MLCSVAYQLESGLVTRLTYTADFEYSGVELCRIVINRHGGHL